MDQAILHKVLSFQKNEITEFKIYSNLAATAKKPEHQELLKRIANDELRHYNILKAISKRDVRPSAFSVWKYTLISRMFGLTFGIKLMENGEEAAQENYSTIESVFPGAAALQADENEHEKQLIAMLDEEALRYVSSVVLGLNDALVELTGALSGFTLALQQTKLIAMTGAITGIAAALSMGASEYLPTRSEDPELNGNKSPLRASFYTTIAYITTVVFLIVPYLIFSEATTCLGISMLIAITIIATFNYYLSVAKDLSFRHRFFEMTTLSLGVAGISFLIGYICRIFFGIDI